MAVSLLWTWLAQKMPPTHSFMTRQELASHRTSIHNPMQRVNCFLCKHMAMNYVQNHFDALQLATLQLATLQQATLELVTLQLATIKSRHLTTRHHYISSPLLFATITSRHHFISPPLHFASTIPIQCKEQTVKKCSEIKRYLM
jgi:hypothetical protein